MRNKKIYFSLFFSFFCFSTSTGTEITWQRIYETNKQQPNFSPLLPNGSILHRVPNITCFVMAYAFAVDFLREKSHNPIQSFSSSFFIKNNPILSALSHYTRPDPAVLQLIIQNEFKEITDRLIFIDFSPDDHEQFFSGENKGKWFTHYGYSSVQYYKSWRTCYDPTGWENYVSCLEEFAAAPIASCAFVTHITGGMRHVVVLGLEKKNGVISGFFYDSLNGDYYDKKLFEELFERIECDLRAASSGRFTMTHNVNQSKISQEQIAECIDRVELFINLETTSTIVSITDWFYEAARCVEEKKLKEETKLFHLLNGRNSENPVLFVSVCEYFFQLGNIIFPQKHDIWAKYIEGNESYAQIGYIDLQLLKQARDSRQNFSWDQERLIKHAIERLSQKEDCYFLIKTESGQFISTQQQKVS